MWQAFSGFGAAMAFGPIGLTMTTAWLRSRIERQFPPLGDVVEVEGVGLHVVDVPAAADDAPVMVILHGTACSLRDPLAALGPALEGRARLLFLDRPGHGYSFDEHGSHAGLSEQADLVAALLDRLGIDKAVIVGHSFGGSVAAAFAVRHQPRTAAAVLVSPATHPWDDGFAWQRDLVSAPVVGSLFVDTLVTPLALSMLDGSVASVFAPEPVPADIIDRTGAPLAVRPEAVRATSREVAVLNDHLARLVPRYSELKVPVTLIAGDADQVVPVGLHAHPFVARAPHTELVLLSGAGHMPHHTNTPAVVAAIERVLARVAGNRPSAPRAAGARAGRALVALGGSSAGRPRAAAESAGAEVTAAEIVPAESPAAAGGAGPKGAAAARPARRRTSRARAGGIKAADV
ncbi:alpha/beta hydrolase [Pseudoxanthobacter sp.]|uniref:alpha/beta fold hydrolase n=1 Tax=Pseudoxanthobacter sp. TaxID=1925742 RepID=UPI002FE0889B